MISKNMLIPDRSYCFRLLKKYDVPHHIVKHSMRVAQVGLYLTGKLAETGQGLDEKLVEAASLLHDIAKMESIRQGGDHADMACIILSSLGFPDVGNIVRQHVILDTPFSEINETIIVNYSDKRVRHTEIVSLEERFDYIQERYGKKPEIKVRINKIFLDIREIETVIFRNLSFEPGTLNELNAISLGC
jgi:putative nucleotidyltransferase with HDIG domain